MNMPAHYQTLEYARVEKLFTQLKTQNNGPLRVLDYGCGRGKYLRRLKSLGHELTGADLNPDYVVEAREAGFEAFSPDELFANERRFDVVFCSHLIEHLSPAELADLVPSLCGLLGPGGRLVLITPMLGERFYHDLTHIRPYYPQSIRHAFGQTASEVSFGAVALIDLVDIYFFKDPYRTRTWRSFYINRGVAGLLTSALNRVFDILWRGSGGRIGATTSWLGVYECRQQPHR